MRYPRPVRAREQGDEPGREGERGAGPPLWLVAFLLAALLLGSVTARVGVALRDPGFDRTSAVGMLKSDPALLFYLTARILEAEGRAPADYRADPRIEHPRRVDVSAELGVAQEFPLAWAQLFTAKRWPLHMTALGLMALFAALAMLGAYGLGRELGASRFAGLFAAALWCLMPASYRTAGFLLMREDVAFPLLALHLWALAAALRRGGAARFAVSGLLLAGALATWHAAAFFVAIEAAALWCVFLATGRSPLAARGSAWIALPLVAASVAVPVLRASGALLSPALILGAGLLVGAALASRARRGLALGAGIATVLVGLALRAVFAEELAAHAHVFDVLWAKLRHLGVRPADPRELSFDARLLWQGPFETLRPAEALRDLGLGLLGAAGALALLRPGSEGTQGGRHAAWALLALLSLCAAWLVARSVILPGLLLPALLAGGLARFGTLPRVRLATGLLVLQGLFFARWIATHEIHWYRPLGRQAETALLIPAVDRLVPPGKAVAADFMISTAILAHTGRPILFQPKYEAELSRRRIEEFVTALYQRGPEELRELLVTGYDCRYLVLDRVLLGSAFRYLAGLPPGVEPDPGSAVALLLSQDADVLANIPGYELLYRSPPTILRRDGLPYDLFRLYRLSAE